jgi:hypothetical protein
LARANFGAILPGMAKRTYDDKMHLDMPFGEALERFAGTSIKETQANIRRAKSKKPPGDKTPSGGNDDQTNLASLTTRRVRKRNTGL